MVKVQMKFPRLTHCMSRHIDKNTFLDWIRFGNWLQNVFFSIRRDRDWMSFGNLLFKYPCYACHIRSREAVQNGRTTDCTNTDTSPLAADSLRDSDMGEMSVMLSVERYRNEFRRPPDGVSSAPPPPPPPPTWVPASAPAVPPSRPPTLPRVIALANPNESKLLRHRRNRVIIRSPIHRHNHDWNVGGDVRLGGYRSPSFSTSVPSPSPVIFPPEFHWFPSLLLAVFSPPLNPAVRSAIT